MTYCRNTVVITTPVVTIITMSMVTVTILGRSLDDDDAVDYFYGDVWVE